MSEDQKVNDAFAVRIHKLSEGNIGAATLILEWIQYSLEHDQSVDFINMLISNLPFHGEELYSFYARDCDKDMDMFHFRMVGKIVTKRHEAVS